LTLEILKDKENYEVVTFDNELENEFEKVFA
jgi:hypothetical protein